MTAILFIGLYPKPILRRIQPTANRVVACVNHAEGLAVSGSTLIHNPCGASP
jgi:NADH:ubiquinone oxidoreductase subunit 4 (subunit M)